MKYTKVHNQKTRSEVVPPDPKYPGGWQADREKPLNTRQKRGKRVSATGEIVADDWQAGPD
jgi:hypothetical protein